MQWRVSLIACVIVAPLLHASDWKKIAAPNFEIYTTASEREARQTLEIFEQARDFFLKVKPIAVAVRLPVTLIAFDTPREYQPYSPRAFSPAFFTGDEQRDYVVMSDLGSARTRAAIHEYVHLLARDSGFVLPLWLDEGMADVYSTLEANDGKIFIGAIPRDRAYSLTHDKWIRLPDLVKVRRGSPEYNEQNRAGIFYGESWLLAHMLMLGDPFSAKFPEFLNQVSDSGSSQAAFSNVYGKTLAEIETAMSAYFRQRTIGGAVYKFEFQKVEVGPVQPVSELETGLTLAKLTGLVGRTDEAQKRMQDLLANHPNDPNIEEAMAYLAWRKGDQQAAVESFQTAFAHGANGWKTHWDYARLLALAGADPGLRVQSLRKTVELQPEMPEPRLLLAQELYGMRRYADSLAELQQIKNPGPRYAARIFLAMASCADQLNQRDDARRYAEEARKSAQTPEEITQADEFLNPRPQRAGAVEKEVPTSLPPAPSSTDADPGRPLLRHRSGSSAPSKPR